MITDATRVAACLVGLGPDVRIVGVDDALGRPLLVHVETTGEPPCPAGCWARPLSKDRQRIELVDLPAFGRPTRLVWHKRRWECPNPGCLMITWTEQNDPIAPARTSMTTRAGRWVTFQVGACARPVSDLATELGCGWHTITMGVPVKPMDEALGKASRMCRAESSMTLYLAPVVHDGLAIQETSSVRMSRI